MLPVSYHLEAVQRWTREAYGQLLRLSDMAGADGRAPAVAFRKLVLDCLKRLGEGAPLIQALRSPDAQADPKREGTLPAADLAAVGRTLRAAAREADNAFDAMMQRGSYNPEALNNAQKLRTLLREVAESAYAMSQAYHHWRGGPDL